jgi:hypothetical protein
MMGSVSVCVITWAMTRRVCPSSDRPVLGGLATNGELLQRRLTSYLNSYD